MKIALDARWIFREISGIGAYTRELVKRLPRLDTENRYLLFFCDAAVRDRTLEETGLQLSERLQTVLLPYGVFSPRGQFLLPRTLRKLGVDIFHSTNYMIPYGAFPRGRAGSIKCVATVHDVIPMIFRHHAPRSKKSRLFPLYRRMMIELGLRADAIISDSAASRSDVIRHLRIPAARTGNVHVVYCGVSDHFTPPAAHAPVTADTERRLLYVGRSDPYKNVTGLVRILARVKELTDIPVCLVVAGSPDPRYPEAPALAAELGVAGSIRWTGYLQDDQLVDLYRSADVLVHASRYEGFGLQIAEGMACGLPVVCSNAGSIPEVAGEAAIMHSPDDIQGFANSIVNVLEDPAVALDMRTRGLRHAAHFTWDRTARETLQIYRSMDR